MKITLKKRTVRQQKTWVVDWHPPGGKRQRRFFGTKGEAEKHKADLEEQHNRGRTAWVALTAAQQADWIMSYEHIRNAGTTAAAVLEYWRRGNTSQQVTGCTLGEAVKRCIESRRETNCRAKYMAKLGAFLNRFATDREALPIGQIGLKDVQEFLAAGNDDGPFKPITRNTYLRYLQVFFNYCAEQKFIANNPIAKQIRNARVDFVEPTILTNEQVVTCLNWARERAPELLAYVTIALFGGVRPEEIDQMRWDMVELEHGLLRLPAEITKDRRPRQCHLQPVAVEWLKLAKSVGAKLPLNGRERMRKMQALRDLLGFKAWPHDVMRHTAGSHMVAKLQDCGRVSLELGNSPEILLRCYRALVRPKQDAEFWALTPEKVRATTAGNNATAEPATIATQLVPA